MNSKCLWKFLVLHLLVKNYSASILWLLRKPKSTLVYTKLCKFLATNWNKETGERGEEGEKNLPHSLLDLFIGDTSAPITRPQ